MINEKLIIVLYHLQACAYDDLAYEQREILQLLDRILQICPYRVFTHLTFSNNSSKRPLWHNINNIEFINYQFWVVSIWQKVSSKRVSSFVKRNMKLEG